MSKRKMSEDEDERSKRLALGLSEGSGASYIMGKGYNYEREGHLFYSQLEENMWLLEHEYCQLFELCGYRHERVTCNTGATVIFPKIGYCEFDKFASRDGNNQLFDFEMWRKRETVDRSRKLERFTTHSKLLRLTYELTEESDDRVVFTHTDGVKATQIIILNPPDIFDELEDIVFTSQEGDQISPFSEEHHVPLTILLAYNILRKERLAAHTQSEYQEAFVMASHRRAGVSSSLHVLPSHIMRNVLLWGSTGLVQ